MKYLDCPMEYVIQTGRTFNTIYKEHIYDINSNNSNSRYSSRILNTGHTYGTIEKHQGNCENRGEGTIFEIT
jgi:hypothetical protein